MPDSILEKIKRFSDDQYGNENRFNARIRIYDFCEKKVYWPEFAFSNLDFNNVLQILELGCGNGQLWINNINRVPENVNIVLSDISEGMVDSVKKELGEDNRFDFEVTDACKTPFESSKFQMIIANHMLYHIENKEQVFSEIGRLLTDDGHAYASTLSTVNFQELFRIADEFDKNLMFDRNQTIQSFNLENGRDILSGYFDVMNSYVFQNDVVVKDTEPLILYLASCYLPEQLGILVEKINNFRSYLESFIEKNGEIRITNKVVLFKFRKK